MAIGDELNQGKEAAKELRQETQFLVDAFTSLGATISNAINTALDDAQNLDTVSKKIAKTYERDITNGLKKINTGLDKQLELQIKVNKGQDISKELEKEKIRRQATVQSIQSRINLLTANDVKLKEELEANLIKELDASNKILKNLEKQNKEREKNVSLSEKVLGGVDGFLKTIDKSGNLAKIFNLDKTNEGFKKINKLAKNYDIPASKKLSLQAGVFFKNIDKTALRAFVLKKAFDLTLKVAKQLDDRLTNIRKEFGLSRGEAGKLNFELTNTFGDLAANVENILKANKALNKSLGDTGVIFDEEIRESAAATQFRLGLSEEAIGNLGKLALSTGREFKEVELSQAKGAISAEKEFGIRLNLKNVLEEANQITGALRINTEKLPGGIAKAVSVAKSLGAEFKTIAEAAGTLLDFESSIEKELQAELLIGKDLNLERARLLALNGDIEGVSRELVAQAGSLEELQNMNVIQQQALAGALGLSSDQLSDILLNQKSLNAVAQEGLDRDAQKVLEQEKALSVQQQLTLLTEKFNDVLKIGLGLMTGVVTALALLLAIPSGGASLALLGGLAVGGGVAAAQYIGDGIAPSNRGPFTITDNFGATAITTQGDGIAVSPNINQATDNGEAKRTNMLLEKILTKQGTVQIDSTKAGTAFTMGTYQVQ